MDPQDLTNNNQDPSNNDGELSVEELEIAAGGGGGDSGIELPSDINENGCSGGNCNC